MSVNHLLNSLELRHKITEVIAYYFAPLPNFLECQLAPIFLSRYQPQHHLLPHLDKACGRNKFSCGETASCHSQFPNGSMQAKKPDRPDPAFCCLPLIYVLRCNNEYSNSYWKEQKWVGGPKTLGVPGLHSILEKIANLSNGE